MDKAAEFTLLSWGDHGTVIPWGTALFLVLHRECRAFLL